MILRKRPILAVNQTYELLQLVIKLQVGNARLMNYESDRGLLNVIDLAATGPVNIYSWSWDRR